jgi:ATP-binding cassette subfamily F protein 3
MATVIGKDAMEITRLLQDYSVFKVFSLEGDEKPTLELLGQHILFLFETAGILPLKKGKKSSIEEVDGILSSFLDMVCFDEQQRKSFVKELFEKLEAAGMQNKTNGDVNEDVNESSVKAGTVNLLLPLENPVSMSEAHWIRLLQELYGLEVNKTEYVDPLRAGATGSAHTSLVDQKKLSLELLSSSRTSTTSILDTSRLGKAEIKLRQKQARKARAAALQIATFQTSTLGTGLSGTVSADDPSILQPADKTRKTRDVKLEKFDVNIGGRNIITEGDLTLPYGRRIGLVGRNGVGKSTLLRAISSRQLAIPKHVSILHVEQEVVGDDTPARLSVLKSDTLREALLQREAICLKKCTILSDGPEKDLASEELAKIYARLEEMESDKAESRASVILSGLGFSKEAQENPTKTFSGGWRMRLALARALFCRPDLLLLDEPTNMLDIPAVAWLQAYLTQQWTGTILVVSHDRDFLDNICTDIIHLHHEALDSYKGNYTQFVVTREERRKHYEKEFTTNLAYRQHLQEFIDKWRYNAARAALAQSKIKILEKLPVLKPWPIDPPIVLSFPSVEDRPPPPWIQLDTVSFYYTSAMTSDATASQPQLLLSNVSFSVQADTRVAIVGPNGAGKTTVLKLMSGALQPTQGRAFIHGRVRMAFFSQHHVDQLDLGSTPIQFLASKYPGKTDEEYRRHAGSFGLSGSLALQPIYTLSGGQKSRLVFASMSLTYPHVLVLDEPTNHLDADSIDALIESLKKFTGAIVVVSHDARFVEAVCPEIWVCSQQTLSKFPGSIRDYVRSLTIDIPAVSTRTTV